MDQTNQFSSNNSAPGNTSPINNTPSTAEKPKKIGPIITILIIILIIVIVALYSLASRVSVTNTSLDTSAVIDNQMMSSASPTPVAPKDITPVTNTADDLKSLQNDLDTSISGIDTQNI